MTTKADVAAWVAAQQEPPPTGFTYPVPHDCLAGTVPSLPSFTPSSYWSGRQTIIQRQQANTPAGSIAFIGDSITESLCVSAVSPAAVNFGIAGDQTIGVLNRLAATTSLHQAGAVVLLIGINDLYDQARFWDVNLQIAKILGWLTGPLVFLYLWRVNPATVPAAGQPYINPNIDYMNGLSASVLAGRPNCVTIDTNALLCDPATGYLKAAYSAGDPHLNTAGYNVLIPAIQSALAQVLS